MSDEKLNSIVSCVPPDSDNFDDIFERALFEIENERGVQEQDAAQDLIANYENILAAIQAENLDAVKAFVQFSNQPNIINFQEGLDGPPLSVAVASGFLPIVDYLIENGAEIHLQEPVCGYTPLHSAALRGDLDIVRFLVQKNANVNLTNNYGNTPLCIAAYKDNLEIVKFLVEEGNANIHSVNNCQETPIVIAFENKHFRIVRYLLEQGSILPENLTKRAALVGIVVNNMKNNTVSQPLANEKNVLEIADNDLENKLSDFISSESSITLNEELVPSKTPLDLVHKGYTSLIFSKQSNNDEGLLNVGTKEDLSLNRMSER